MPSLLPLANHATESGGFVLPEDGWYQLAPAGEFPVTAGGERLVQVLDEAAFAAMAAAFGRAAAEPGFPGLLVDFDHFSLDLGKPSEAAGWLAELALREGALWGRIRWTERGRQAVTGGSYRFLSPVFDRAGAEPLDGSRLRPLRLLGAGLTNDPNLRGIRPLSNRNGGEPPQPQENAPMKQHLASILELPPDAPDDAFLAAVRTLRNRETEHRAEQDLAAYGDRIADAAQAKAALLANREAAIGILSALHPAPVPNRRDGKIPGDQPGGEAAAVAIRNRAHQIQRDQRVPFTTAWNLAQQELA